MDSEQLFLTKINNFLYLNRKEKKYDMFNKVSLDKDFLLKFNKHSPTSLLNHYVTLINDSQDDFYLKDNCLLLNNLIQTQFLLNKEKTIYAPLYDILNLRIDYNKLYINDENKKNLTSYDNDISYRYSNSGIVSYIFEYDDLHILSQILNEKEILSLIENNNLNKINMDNMSVLNIFNNQKLMMLNNNPSIENKNLLKNIEKYLINNIDYNKEENKNLNNPIFSLLIYDLINNENKNEQIKTILEKSDMKNFMIFLFEDNNIYASRELLKYLKNVFIDSSLYLKEQLIEKMHNVINDDHNMKFYYDKLLEIDEIKSFAEKYVLNNKFSNQNLKEKTLFKI